MQILSHFDTHPSRRRKKARCLYFSHLLKSFLLLLSTQTNVLAAIQVIPTNPQVDYQEESARDESCFQVSPKTSMCNIAGYQTIMPFKNSLGHSNIDAAVEAMEKYYALASHPTYATDIQLFLCSLFLPVCVSTNSTFSTFLLPCREECEKATNRIEAIKELVVSRGDIKLDWDCRQFKPLSEGICVNLNVTSTSSASNNIYSSNPYPSPQISPIDSTSLLDNRHDTTSSCGAGMFDCQIPGHSLCIEDKFVCDSKPDCMKEGKGQTNLDEIGCDEKKCPTGHFYCDGKCLNRTQAFCNGELDCSSGIDELHCDFNLDPAGVIYATFVAITALLSIFWCINRLCIYDDDSKDLNKNHVATDQGSFVGKNPIVANNNEVPQNIIYGGEQENLIGVDPVQISSENLASAINNMGQQVMMPAPCPIYNEPANSDCYTITTSYQRLNIGGNSGLSSVYNGVYNIGVYDDVHHMGSDVYVSRDGPLVPTTNLYDIGEPPAAPPPSPNQQIYSNDSIISEDRSFSRNKLTL